MPKHHLPHQSPSFFPTISFSFSPFPKIFSLSTKISLYLKPLPLFIQIYKSGWDSIWAFWFQSQLGFWIFVISVCRYISISPSISFHMFVYVWLYLCSFTYICLYVYIYVCVVDFEFDFDSFFEFGFEFRRSMIINIHESN